ncbi:MAG: ribonuclease H [Acidimicrobiia bacterium]
MALTCQNCGRQFTVPQHIRERYPGWEPRLCASCHAEAGSHREPSLFDSQSLLTLDEVLATYTAGPTTGVFTDGSSVPNPGPGGWGAVYVVSDQILDQAHGHETFTTNNRMELTALSSGIDLVPEGTEITVYTDSNLAYRTFTEWAAGWEARGWKRKSGPIQNLDLVRPIYEKLQVRPELTLKWIAAHSGYRWNEYADALASMWLAEA